MHLLIENIVLHSWPDRRAIRFISCLLDKIFKKAVLFVSILFQSHEMINCQQYHLSLLSTHRFRHSTNSEPTYTLYLGTRMIGFYT